MRKAVFYITAICFLFSLAVFVSRAVIAQEKVELMMETYTGPTVTISGRVTFSAFKEGQRIAINAKSYPGAGPPDISTATIMAPGEYSLKVPQNAGKVYITAIVLEPGQFSPSRDNIVKVYSKNPLEIRGSDIKNINIELVRKFDIETYTGPTVIISGRVTFSAFKEGQRIAINAKSYPGAGPPDIAPVKIVQPGEYSIKVPQNIGNVYITTVVLGPGELHPNKDSLRQKYNKGRPIKVGSSDISGINMAIQ